MKKRKVEGIKEVEGFECYEDENYSFSFSAVRLKYSDKETDTVTGILLYPDDFTFEKAGVDVLPLGTVSAKKRPITTIDLTTWEKLNNVGVIFMPNEPEFYMDEIDFEPRVSFWTSSTALEGEMREWNGGDISLELNLEYDKDVFPDLDSYLYYFDYSFFGYGSSRKCRQAVRLARDVDGTASGTYRKQVKETKDTLRCGNTYIWDLGYKLREITQTETEKEYTD